MDNKKTVKKAALLYSLLYFVLFLIFYLPNYVPECNEFVEISFKTPYLIIRGVLERLFEFFIPASAAAILLSFAEQCGKRRALVNAIFLSLPILVYSLPYCYLYALSLGFDSIEGIVISMLFSACGIILQWCHTLLLFLVAAFITAKKTKGGAFDGHDGDDMSESSSPKRFGIKFAFDFSKPLIFGILVISLGELAYNVILEIINTVSYFIEAAGSYTAYDVIDIMGTYLFLLATMIISHIVFCFMTARRGSGENNAEI